MTDTAVPDSALGKQLIADIDSITMTFDVDFPAFFNQREVLRDIEREKEKSRVLTNYVASLLDRVEQLEKRAGAE